VTRSWGGREGGAESVESAAQHKEQMRLLFGELGFVRKRERRKERVTERRDIQMGTNAINC
jgi:hypothetical protein